MFNLTSRWQGYQKEGVGGGGGGSTSEATSLPGGFSQPTVLIQPKTCRHDRTLVHCSCKEEIYIWLGVHVVYRRCWNCDLCLWTIFFK